MRFVRGQWLYFLHYLYVFVMCMLSPIPGVTTLCLTLFEQVSNCVCLCVSVCLFFDVPKTMCSFFFHTQKIREIIFEKCFSHLLCGPIFVCSSSLVYYRRSLVSVTLITRYDSESACVTRYFSCHAWLLSRVL